ncbi:MAG: hypothetical protein MK188_07420 [Gammaproteobacteria bacterium]|nr:hypothetical protein [Gammaproteobacteria bacterium]
MRYREGEIPKEQLAVHASDNMLILTAVIGVLVGIALTVIGKKGKQMWMWVWGIGLVIFSAYLGLSIALEIKLFGHF